MAWPPSDFDTDLTNDTATRDLLAPLLNDLGAAFNDLVDEIGSDPGGDIAGKQPLDSDLTAIAALSTTAYGRALLTLADNAALGALLSSIYQPLDSDLTAIAALTTTAYGRAFLALADQAALMALLSAATTSASGIVEQATTAETQAGTDDSRYVTPLGRLAAAEVRTVRVASGSNVTIATALNSGDTIDGVTLADGDLVLLAGQTSTSENGIYVVSASPARSTAMATGMTVKSGTLVVVQEGTLSADAVFMLTTNGVVTVGTTGMTWTNLRSAIGAQPLDADLTALAGLSGVQGDIIYRDASQWQRLAKGSAFQGLRTNSGATAPEWAFDTESIIIAVGDETTALTTGTAKVTFRMPYAFKLTGIRASVTTAPTGATLLTVDVNESGSSVISTKLTFDASEKTTTTAATPPVISDDSLADDAEITIDIDAVGSTIAGAGLKVYLIGYKNS